MILLTLIFGFFTMASFFQQRVALKKKRGERQEIQEYVDNKLLDISNISDISKGELEKKFHSSLEEFKAISTLHDSIIISAMKEAIDEKFSMYQKRVEDEREKDEEEDRNVMLENKESKSAMDWLNLGKEHLYDGEFSDAVNAFKSCLSENSNIPEAHNYLALAYCFKRRVEDLFILGKHKEKGEFVLLFFPDSVEITPKEKEKVSVKIIYNPSTPVAQLGTYGAKIFVPFSIKHVSTLTNSLTHAKEALRLNPQYLEAQYNVALLSLILSYLRLTWGDEIRVWGEEIDANILRDAICHFYRLYKEEPSLFSGDVLDLFLNSFPYRKGLYAKMVSDETGAISLINPNSGLKFLAGITRPVLRPDGTAKYIVDSKGNTKGLDITIISLRLPPPIKDLVNKYSLEFLESLRIAMFPD